MQRFCLSNRREFPHTHTITLKDYLKGKKKEKKEKKKLKKKIEKRKPPKKSFARLQEGGTARTAGRLPRIKELERDKAKKAQASYFHRWSKMDDKEEKRVEQHPLYTFSERENCHSSRPATQNRSYRGMKPRRVYW